MSTTIGARCDVGARPDEDGADMYLTGHQEKGSRYYDAIYAKGYNTEGYRPLYDLVLKMLESFPSPKVLEIGCGVGDLGKLIAEKNYPYRGFDFSEEAIKCCKRLCPQGNFWVGDAYEDENYLPHDYNVAIALEVLEHVDDVRIIKNIPAGVRFIASVPDYNDVAHLRLYSDPQRDIVERFRPHLNVLDIKALRFENANTGDQQTIFVFYGIRKASVIIPQLEPSTTW